MFIFIIFASNMITVVRFHRLAMVLIMLASASICWAQKKDRSYEGPGNWFMGIDVGSSLSLAENVDYSNFYRTRIPSGSVQFGRTLTPKWSVRLSAAISAQMGNPSSGAIRYLPDVFSPYQFVLAIGTFDVMLNLANVFRKYDSRNWYDGYLVIGGGQLYRFYVDDKVNDWYEDIYPVMSYNHRYWTAKVGYEAAWHIRRSCDLTFEIDFHVTDNAYNGVVGGSQSFDFFTMAKLGIVYYIPNGKHRQRFANPRRYHQYWTELN